MKSCSRHGGSPMDDCVCMFIYKYGSLVAMQTWSQTKRSTACGSRMGTVVVPTNDRGGTYSAKVAGVFGETNCDSSLAIRDLSGAVRHPTMLDDADSGSFQ